MLLQIFERSTVFANELLKPPSLFKIFLFLVTDLKPTHDFPLNSTIVLELSSLRNPFSNYSPSGKKQLHKRKKKRHDDDMIRSVDQSEVCWKPNITSGRRKLLASTNTRKINVNGRNNSVQFSKSSQHQVKPYSQSPTNRKPLGDLNNAISKKFCAFWRPWSN